MSQPLCTTTGANEALTQLKKVVSLGYDDLEWVENEPAFDSLRTNARYLALIKQLKEGK